MYLSKDLFISAMRNQANEKMRNEDRRRRLDGRLELATLNIFSELLPESVEFERGNKNNYIKQDYISRNILVNYDNLHLFNNNTSYIVFNNNTSYKFYNLVIVKATFQGCVRIPSSAIVNDRLTLKEIKNLLELGVAKRFETLEDLIF